MAIIQTSPRGPLARLRLQACAYPNCIYVRACAAAMMLLVGGAQTVAMLGYDDALMTVDKVMVRTDKSGKFAALSLEDYYEAKKSGRISPGYNGIENLAPLAPAAATSD